MKSAQMTKKMVGSLRSTLLLSVLLWGALACTSSSQAQDKPEVDYLWGAYDEASPKEVFKNDGEKVSNIHQPSLTVFRPKKANGLAIVICPGGGYQRLAIKKEGYDVARKLNESGITAFVLKYRLPATKRVDFKHPVPLSDALRAIQWVRHHSEDYGIDKQRVGIMGFSAGGHLAATASTLYGERSFGDDEVSKLNPRPDFACLGYAVISTKKGVAHHCVKSLLPKSGDLKELSCELHVNADTSPTFLFHAKDDTPVKYENSQLMHEALKKVGVKTELKIYETGGHGFGLGKEGADSKQWVSHFLAWLHNQGFTSEPEEFFTPKEDLEGLKENTDIKDGLPNVLIIGDSISIGYTLDVIAKLKDVANVQRVRANAGNTKNGLKRLDQWLGKTKWDVIHFNWGLHDLCYRHPESKVQGNRDKVRGTQAIPLAEYAVNLEELVIKLKETGAALVWASTTVIPEREAGRFAGDDVKYNEAAAGIMKKHGVDINDLHAFSKTIMDDMKGDKDDVHFTKEGYKKLGEHVSQEISKVLERL